MPQKDVMNQLADDLGKSAEQLQAAVTKLLKLYAAHQESKEADQAKLREGFAKQLKKEGFEPSDENIALFKAHTENIAAAEKELDTIDAQIQGLDKEALSPDDKALRLEKLTLDRDTAALNLQELSEGKGLAGLKVDKGAQALKSFKAGSNGDAMMKSGGLSPAAQIVAGVKAAVDTDGVGLGQSQGRSRARTR